MPKERLAQAKEKTTCGRSSRSALATTLTSSCLAVSAVAANATPPLVSFTDYPVAGVLDKLLVDKTTGRNITIGNGSSARDILARSLSTMPPPIRPRVEKSRIDQSLRTKKNAEVFTPSWLCKKMNDFLDGEIFNRVEHVEGVVKPQAVAWQEYVDTRVLEITCGEAPFIVSRYDATTGEIIPLKDRSGILDRKLCFVSKYAKDEAEWKKWAVRAYESVYGYEYQGDSLLIARVNLLITFAENVKARWGRKATKKELTEIANRIAWNFWQMDGLKGTVTHRIDEQFLPGFEDCEKKPEAVQDEFDLGTVLTQRRVTAAQAGLAICSEPSRAERVPRDAESVGSAPLADRDTVGSRVPRDRDEVDSSRLVADIDTRECVIFDWRKRCKVIYNDIGKKEAKTMKFDYAIGNPPYQEEAIGDNRTYAPPVYHKFMDGAYTVADKVELVTPARFLFNAGSTPKSWNQKMLMDSHLGVLEYYADSKKVFPSITDLTGGVVVSYYDNNNENGQAIELFTQYQELNAIFQKVESASDFKSMASSVLSRTVYRLTPRLHRDFPDAASHLSEGHMFDMASNIFDSLPKVFLEKLPKNCSSDNYVKILGRVDRTRVYRYMRRAYLNTPSNLNTYKVVLARADGSAGTIGRPVPARILGNLMVEIPGVGLTESFLSIGAFRTRKEAECVLKYCKTKFVRTLVGVLKTTQDITPQKWKYVPLQDFTSASDIDWSKSVKEIDRQLYKKYKLSRPEIDFIETHVKEMD